MEIIIPFVLLIVGCIILSRRALDSCKVRADMTDTSIHATKDGAEACYINAMIIVVIIKLMALSSTVTESFYLMIRYDYWFH